MALLISVKVAIEAKSRPVGAVSANDLTFLNALAPEAPKLSPSNEKVSTEAILKFMLLTPQTHLMRLELNGYR